MGSEMCIRDRATGEHKVAFELRGHSATEKPEIQLIEIEGVSGPSTTAGGG